MKKETYYCDLCKEEIKEKDNLRKLYFKCDVIPQRYVLVSMYDKNSECDKHICIDCIETIKNSDKT